MAQNTSSGPPMEPRASDGNSGAATADMTWNPWNEGNTLGFDGGGIRGYWSLLVLRSLMLKIKEAEEAMDDDARSSFHPEHAPSAISQLTYASATHFLPCHYFDLIGGTSTGALIAIMLSMFRMTVEDCIDEYKKMGTAIFGRPRTLHAIRLPPLTRTKFSTKNLTESFESVIRRRAVNTENLTSRVRFRTEPGTCRGQGKPLEE
ncbi:FabD/lysophospholipase-like protein [Apiospora arundinis]